MNTTKEKQLKLQITISVLSLTMILFSEMYLMINFKESYLPIIILAVIALVAVYVLVNAFMVLNDEKEAKREEHFENIHKSDKASYIMLKKSFDEIEEKLNELQEASKIPAEEIINAQKGMAKLIINRSKENADAIINSNDQVLEKVDKIKETQDTQFTSLSQEYGLKLSDMSTHTDMKIQDLVVQLKDAELRLNQAIMNGTKVVMPTPVSYASMETVTKPVVEEVITTEETMVEETISAEPVFVEETESVIEQKPVVEEVIEPVVEEVVEEKPPMPDLSDPNKMMSPDDIAALLANMSEPEPVVEEVVEEKTPMPDLSDPNKMMSPDDIAALLANMSEPEPVVEEVVEEKPPMPDLSDPNKMMSPDDIAALIANL